MGAIISFLASTLTSLLSWLFNVAILKFIIFGSIFILISEFLPIIMDLFLTDFDEISALISGVPPEVGYFLAPFHVDVGIKSMISAYTARFIIRRLPFVG